MKAGTKMDPNLEKFIETNRKDIEKGKTFRVISDAQDYLFKVASSSQASIELSAFVTHIKKMKVSKKSD